MPVVNRSKDTVLADKFLECRSSWQQTRGMMFRRSVIPLVFYFGKEQLLKLHSWFCPDDLDLVFLDENLEVVEIFCGWPKRSFYSSRNRALVLLELPCGSVFRSKTEVGDVINIYGGGGI